MGMVPKVIKLDIEELELYEKNDIEIHFIESLSVATEGENILIPTLEGNVMVAASQDQYIMIGPCNDIYPIPKALFQLKYSSNGSCTDQNVIEFIHSLGWKYVKINKCKLLKKSYIYAKKILYPFKVYTKHCENVLDGNKGDYYAVTYEDFENAYVIKKEIMEQTYKKVNEMD